MPYPDPGFYWILVSDEPEPAYYDGSGWALIGGAEMDDAKILSGDPLEFQDQPVQ